MNKKWLITIGIVLGIVVLGVAAYFAWQNRKQITQIIPGIVGGGIPPAQQIVNKLKILSSREVEEYWLLKTSSSSEILYFDTNKNIFKIDKDGVETTDVVALKGATGVVPDPSGKVLFAKLNNEGGVALYDSVSNTRKGDFIGIDTAAWGPEDGKIAMLVTGNDQGLVTPQIEVGNINDKKPLGKILESPVLQGFNLVWPQKDSLFLTQKPSAEYISDIWKVDLKTNKLSKFLSDRGLIVQWSPFGDRALEFITTEGREHKLSLIDNNGNRLKEFKFVTMPDKCVMTTASQVYCAIPRDQESLTHMTLPDDYLKRSVYFKDGIYQIDIDKDSIRGIFEDENPNIDATDLTVLGNKLLFINRYDRKLYSLDLQ